MNAICYACGHGDEWRGRRVLSDLCVSACLRCGFVVGHFNIATHAAGDYDELIDMKHYDSSIGRMRQMEAVQHVRSLMDAPEKTWLDIGCGVGAVLKQARASEFSITAVEPDDRARRIVLEQLGETKIFETFQPNIVADASQGVISMLDVLEHIPPEQLAHIAALVWSKLVPGGYWLIKVPSSEGLFYRVATAVASILPGAAQSAVHRLWMTKYAAPHRTYFSENSLRCFVERYGFEAAPARYLVAIPTRTIWSRLRMDQQIPLSRAIVMAPFIAALNALEFLMNKTDSMVLIARKPTSSEIKSGGRLGKLSALANT